MPSTELAKFIGVALKIQSSPFEGVRVVNGTLIATNGYQLVAWETRNWTDWITGEGVIPPVTADVIRAYAKRTYVRRVAVTDNVVEIEVQTTRLEGSEAVAGEWETVTLPTFYAPRAEPEKYLAQTRPPQARLVAEDIGLKAVKEAKAKDMLVIVDDPADGEELFRPARGGEPLRYSAHQIRECLPIFARYSRMSAWVNEKGWLALRDQYGCTFAVTPFTKREVEE